MPQTDVIFYQEDEGEDVPVLDWLKKLRRSDQRAYESCVAAIGRLAEFGHELRRPLADILGDGIHELRIRKGRVNYRILYFFHGRNIAILGHALTKEDKVPNADVERAIRRKKAFEADPLKHSFTEMEGA
jgi:phage-related protein